MGKTSVLKPADGAFGFLDRSTGPRMGEWVVLWLLLWLEHSWNSEFPVVDTHTYPWESDGRVQGLQNMSFGKWLREVGRGSRWSFTNIWRAIVWRGIRPVPPTDRGPGVGECAPDTLWLRMREICHSKVRFLGKFRVYWQSSGRGWMSEKLSQGFFILNVTRAELDVVSHYHISLGIMKIALWNVTLLCDAGWALTVTSRHCGWRVSCLICDLDFFHPLCHLSPFAFAGENVKIKCIY